MTATLFENDYVILEDLDFDPECTARDACSSKAEWSTEKTCCGEYYYFCEPCRMHNEKFDDPRYQEFRCNDCGAVGSTLRMFFTNWVRL